ncbi:GntR family transcriptional regulator [bacterium]|nr:MAG: GntR family transcriptional regulator [bacterium]
MLEAGRFNTLSVLRDTSVGFYLGDSEGGEVLLPKKYIPENTTVGDSIDVFLYHDSEDRLIATTLMPTIQLNQFEILTCKDVSKNGAFMDWGLEKDLLVPHKEQRVEMEVGKSYLVYLFEDEKTGRLAGSSKIYQFLSNDYLTVKEKDEVELIILDKTDLGYNAIVNEVHQGLLYENQVFKLLEYGERIKGYVFGIREDKKIDLRLQRVGLEGARDSAEIILEKLSENKGFLPLHDKSSAEEVYETLNMSKKQFKRAVGNLYKQGKIEIKENGIQKK